MFSSGQIEFFGRTLHGETRSKIRLQHFRTPLNRDRINGYEIPARTDGQRLTKNTGAKSRVTA